MTKLLVSGLFIFQILFVVGALRVSVNVFSVVTNLFAQQTSTAVEVLDANSQQMPLLEAPANSSTSLAAMPLSSNSDTTDIPTNISTTSDSVSNSTSSTTPSVSDASLSTASIQSTTDTSKPASTPTTASATDDGSYKVITYKVKTGDTISGIAANFGISNKTILQANSLTAGSKLKVGQSLTILPVDGIQYKVTSGDSLGRIASRFSASVSDILVYNGLDKNSVIKAGQILLIPNAVVSDSAQVSAAANSVKSTISKAVQKVASATLGVNVAHADTGDLADGYYMRPIKAGVKTQGIHDNNAVDLADSCGTAVYAAAAGSVTVAKDNSAWNGGFGNYVEINHSNGSQTLYAHFEKTEVSVGDQVAQGQEIGKMGETGEATGCHVHFEIHDGPVNPF